MDDLAKRAEDMMTRRRAKYCCSDNHCMCDEDADLVEALLAERCLVEIAVREILHEWSLQLEYLDDRSPSGTTPAVLAEIKSALEE